MNEVTELEAQMKSLLAQMQQDADVLKKAIETVAGETRKQGTERSSRSCSRTSKSSRATKRSQCSQSTPAPTKEAARTSKELLVAINFEIPVCYGSIELREALTNARNKLKMATEVITTTKQQMPIHVQRDMEDLLDNFAVLCRAFSLMNDRMEMHVDDSSDDIT